MAQERYWNWKDDDYTLDLSRDKLGMIEPGVYRGFDVSSFDNDMTLDLDHLDTGIVETDLQGTQSNPKGVIVTRQGVVVKEDAEVSVVISQNTSGSERIDVVALYHEYVETQGGMQATYSIIQGTPGGGVPSLTSPEYQIKIGELHLPDGTTALDQSGVEWIREEVPNLGNKTLPQNVAIKNEENIFTTLQVMAQGAEIDTDDANFFNGSQILFDQLSSVGNFFNVTGSPKSIQQIKGDTLPSYQAGMRITLRFVEAGHELFVAATGDWSVRGGHPDHDGVLQNIVLRAGSVITFLLRDTGSELFWEVESFGGHAALLDQPNSFEALQEWGKSPGTTNTNNNGVSLAARGNMFDVAMNDGELHGIDDRFQAGTLITVRFVSGTESSMEVMDSSLVTPPSGTDPIKVLFGSAANRFSVGNGDVILFLKGDSIWIPLTGSYVLSRLREVENQFDNQWVVLDITSSGWSNAPGWSFMRYIDSDGFVHLRGDLSASSGAGTMVTDSLPSNIRPSVEVVGTVPSRDGPYQFIYRITPNGELHIEDESGGDPSDEITSKISLHATPYMT